MPTNDSAICRSTKYVISAGSILMQASQWMTVTLLLLSVAAGVTPLLEVWATKGLISALPASVGRGLSPLIPWLGVLVGVLMLSSLVGQATPFLGVRLKERSRNNIEQAVYRKALELELEVFESETYYNMLARALTAIEGSVSGIISIVRKLLCSILSIAGLILFIGRVIHWLPALILLITTLPVALKTVRQSQERAQLTYKQSPSERQAVYFRELLTSPSAAAEIRLFGLAEHFLRRWREMQARLLYQRHQQRYEHARRSIGASVFDFLADGVVMATIIYTGVEGMVGVGAVVSALYVVHQFDSLRVGLGFNIKAAADFLINYHCLSEFLDFKGNEPQNEAGRSPIFQHSIVFNNVSYRYPEADSYALRNIHLVINAGEKVALVGLNGAGKTTLAKLLLGLLQPTEGQILVDGQDLAGIKPSDWRSNATAVLQDFVRYYLSVAENIGFGDIAEVDNIEKVVDAAKRSGAHEFIQQLPNEYKSLLGRGFTGAQELSSGQWQKLAIARAYMRAVPLVVLDEPAASLDALAEMELYMQFVSLSVGKTVLLISHRLASTRLADRVCFLEQGCLVEEGRHEELMAAKGAYGRLYDMQAAWYRDGGTGHEERAGDDIA